jgi:hypothetical protein
MKSCKEELLKLEDLNEIIIIDLDKNKCIKESKRSFSFPDSIIKSLKQDLSSIVQNSKLKLAYEYQKNIELCSAFLKFFVQTLGHYKQFLISNDLSSLSEDSNEFLVSDNKNVILRYIL